MSKCNVSKRFFNHLSKLITIPVSGLIGLISGCSGNAPWTTAAMYGMPTATYKIKGTVTDGIKSVPNLTVTLRDTAATAYTIDSTHTTTDGSYQLEEHTDARDLTVKLSVSDQDGSANGRYASKDTIITIPKTALSNGDGNWNLGTAEKTVTITVTEIK